MGTRWRVDPGAVMASVGHQSETLKKSLKRAQRIDLETGDAFYIDGLIDDRTVDALLLSIHSDQCNAAKWNLPHRWQWGKLQAAVGTAYTSAKTFHMHHRDLRCAMFFAFMRRLLAEVAGYDAPIHAWANVLIKGAAIRAHTHWQADWSAVLWFHHDWRFHFVDERSSELSMHHRSVHDMHHWNTAKKVEAKPGRVLIMQGHVLHGVATVPGTRYSLAINREVPHDREKKTIIEKSAA